MIERLAILATILLASVSFCWTQTGTSNKDKKEVPAASQFHASPTYAELVLRRTELASSLESLILEYTEEYPKVKEIRHVLTLIDRESERLAKIRPTEQSRLTLALGKLIVRKVELETDLWNLQKNYKDEHPDVKRAKRKVEIYENAILEILN